MTYVMKQPARLFEKGLNPVEVATITGHKDTKMLMRYTHLRAENLVERLILASASVFPLRNFLRNYCRASHGDLLSRSVKP